MHRSTLSRALVFGGFFLLYLFSHSLNLIAMGETDAMILGVEVKRIRTCVYIIASLITGAVVSVSGPIAYIGLICPHMGRMMFGSDNRISVPDRIHLRSDFHAPRRHARENSCFRRRSSRSGSSQPFAVPLYSFICCTEREGPSERGTRDARSAPCKL